MKIFYSFIMIILASVISILATIIIVDSSALTFNYKKHSIDSKILEEKRDIIVMLPDKYNLNPDAASSLKTVNHSQQAIELFIGPEGGLNDEETDYLKNNNFTDIRFGPRILRTETAGPAVISAIQMLWGDI